MGRGLGREFRQDVGLVGVAEQGLLEDFHQLFSPIAYNPGDSSPTLLPLISVIIFARSFIFHDIDYTEHCSHQQTYCRVVTKCFACAS